MDGWMDVCMYVCMYMNEQTSPPVRCQSKPGRSKPPPPTQKPCVGFCCDIGFQARADSGLGFRVGWVWIGFRV